MVDNLKEIPSSRYTTIQLCIWAEMIVSTSPIGSNISMYLRTILSDMQSCSTISMYLRIILSDMQSCCEISVALRWWAVWNHTNLQGRPSEYGVGILTVNALHSLLCASAICRVCESRLRMRSTKVVSISTFCVHAQTIWTTNLKSSVPIRSYLHLLFIAR